MSDSLVIIPTYNEKENIEKIITAVFNLNKDFHVLIVDDNSPDGTANIVKVMRDVNTERLFLLQREGKQGLGTAYIAGFNWGLEHNYDYLFEMDADFSHNPKDLERLYHACANEGADLALGSRYVPGGKVSNWPWDRIFMSKGGSFYVRCITWMPVKDPTAGFICYSAKVLNAINLNRIRFTGYAFQIEMKFAAWKLGFKLKEVPITFVDRVEGVSKMSMGIFKEAFFGVIKMRWNSFFSSYKK